MCTTCGCSGEAASVSILSGDGDALKPAHVHGHRHTDGHSHPHRHEHDHAEPHIHGETVEIEARILARNDAQAQRNRGWFAGREILALNLLSAPGAGKTTLIERTIADLEGELPLFVIEGDQAGALDAERIRQAGAPVVQLNTGTGCHLDATMVSQSLAALRPSPGAVLLIENVGNLVCPALFDLGEHAKVVLFSTTEGEDKPVKYPHMFRAADIVILNKADLLPHLDFNVTQAIANLRAVNPQAAVLQVSARTGEGMTEWCNWLRAQVATVHEKAFA